MAPLPPAGKLVGPYSEALHDYLKQPLESELRRAGDLGRDAMLSGVGLSEMSAIHHESVRTLLARILKIDEDAERGNDLNSSPCEDRCQSLKSLAAKEITPTLTAAGNFFAESISTFEFNQREFRQSNTALRYQNSKLEDQVSRVTRVVFEEAMQLLAAAVLALGQASRKLPAAKRGSIDEVQNLLDRLGEQLTGCSGDLRCRVLEDLGLSAAIQSLSRRFSALAQIDITADVKADVAASRLQPEAGMVLYRAVQEALTNVAQHAKAQHVKIWLCEQSGGVQCSVRDDGIGFDASRLFSGIAERGSGLISIRESLRLIGGTLTIHSSPG